MRKLPLSALLLAPLVALGIYACDQQPVEPEFDVADQQQGDFLAANPQNTNPFLGSWKMTSAVVGSEELGVGSGLLYIWTFRSDETYSTSVSNDTEHLACTDPPQTSCAWVGEYSYTATTLTLFEEEGQGPEPGEDTGLYAFCGGKLIYMDRTEQGGLKFTFQRTGLGR